MNRTKLRAHSRYAFLALFLAALGFLTLTYEYDSAQAQRSTAKRDTTAEPGSEKGALMVGNITGRVFQDFNGNGDFDTSGGTAAAPRAIDIGTAGVTVRAYDTAGTQVGTATTAADGTYALSASGTGPYRIEFSGLPSGFFPSARNTDSVAGGNATSAGSTVQFVPNGTTAGVNLALSRPGDHCEDNPEICSQLYGMGDATQPDAVFTVPYSAGSTRTTGGAPVDDFLSPGNTNLAETDQVGTTFGIAYHRATRRVFVSAYMKKHAKFGPGGTGAIYQIDRNTGAVSEFVNLNTVFGANTAGANPHNIANYNTDNGQTTWNAVGKAAFGGMAISDDQAYLFVMNLANRRLYKIPTTGTLDSSTIQSVAFPTSMPSCESSNNVRPFAVNWHEGTVYVGAICSRETTSFLSTNQLRAYVYTLNPSTLTFSSSPVLNFSLTYARNETDPGLSADWLDWRATYNTISGSHFIYPQPMLTDIEFDRGNMMLAFRDRNGDQSGYNNASNPNNSSQLFKGITAGDVLRACGSPGSGWTLESNGRCGSIGSAPQNSGEGPGNGEYYFQDNYHPNGNPHDEVFVGGVMQIPGHNEMVATVFDPAYIPNDNVYDAGGFRWFNNSTGTQHRGYLAFWMGAFGKANGMGNVQALCEAAPIEIGNRVWHDQDQDGVQDPGEAVIAGATIDLYEGSAIVGRAVTDVNGEYYFVSSHGPDTNEADNLGQVNGGIKHGTGYQVRLDNPSDYAFGGPLFGKTLTVVNTASQLGTQDATDSDAVLESNPPGSPAGIFPVVSLTTGTAGSNDHTFDIGLSTAPSAASVSVEGRVVTASGSGIRGVILTLTEMDGTKHYASTGTFGYYRFNGLQAGQGAIIDIRAKRYSFSVSSLFVSLDNDLAAVDFIADQW